MTAGDKRILRGKKTFQKLQDYGWELIKSNEYEAMTIDDICSRLGMTKGAFYYHFSSKDELFQYIYGIKISEAVLDGVKKAAENDPGDLLKQIEQWIKVPLVFVRQYPNKMIFTPSLKMAWTETVEDWVSIQVSEIEKGQAAGLLRNDLTAKEIWEMISAFIYGLSYLWVQGRAATIIPNETYLRSFVGTLRA